MFVLEVLFFDELAGHFRGPLVGLGFELLIFARERTNDERRARFIDKNAVGLIDEHEIQVALNWGLVATAAFAKHRAEQIALALADPALQQAVAEEVETHFVRRAVRDIARILLGPIGLLHLRLDAPDFHAESFVERPHPIGIALSEVIVDRREVCPFAF